MVLSFFWKYGLCSSNRSSTGNTAISQLQVVKVYNSPDEMETIPADTVRDTWLLLPFKDIFKNSIKLQDDVLVLKRRECFQTLLFILELFTYLCWRLASSKYNFSLNKIHKLMSAEHLCFSHAFFNLWNFKYVRLKHSPGTPSYQ